MLYLLKRNDLFMFEQCLIRWQKLAKNAFFHNRDFFDITLLDSENRNLMHYVALSRQVGAFRAIVQNVYP